MNYVCRGFISCIPHYEIHEMIKIIFKAFNTSISIEYFHIKTRHDVTSTASAIIKFLIYDFP